MGSSSSKSLKEWKRPRTALQPNALDKIDSQNVNDTHDGQEASLTKEAQLAEVHAKFAEAKLLVDDEVAQLVGGDSIKTFLSQVRQQYYVAALAAVNAADGEVVPSPRTTRHLVITGPSGTGKTTAARIVARVLHKLGVLPNSNVVVASGKDMVAEYAGQTTHATANVFASATGGVLFIDEAYAIAQDKSYGPQCVTQMLVEMDKAKSDIVVILAGYEKDIKALFKLNAGLAPRFTYQIEMPPLSVTALAAVFEQEAAKAQKAVAATVDVEAFIQKFSSSEKRLEMNGRVVETLLKAVVEQQNARIIASVATVSITPALLLQLEPSDFELDPHAPILAHVR